MTEAPPTKIKLSDQQRSDIRWSNAKVGYVVRLEFPRHCTRRGVHPVSPVLRGVYRSPFEAQRRAADLLEIPWRVGRIPTTPSEVQILKVDHLGNVLEVS